MAKSITALLVGDAMIRGSEFERASQKYLSDYLQEVKAGDWETDWDNLQRRRLEVEKFGPEIEEIPELIKKFGKKASVLCGLFVPISSKVFDIMPNLRIAGVSRAGLENVNLSEATKHGILVFNVRGRNAQAVSDFTVGLMLAECRNIARAHYAIRQGVWRKEFLNSSFIPELKEKTVGIIGFGYIGRLVAKKLSGFDVKKLVYDPFVGEDDVNQAGCIKADKDTLLKESDFITLHARLNESTKGLIGEKELSLVKPTAYIINTARAGLIDQRALVNALKKGAIAGAALDVFWEEPIPQNSELLKLDNVTLTTHLAGTTKEALTRSPELLMEDIAKLLSNQNPRFIVNPEVLKNKDFISWLEEVRQ